RAIVSGRATKAFLAFALCLILQIEPEAAASSNLVSVADTKFSQTRGFYETNFSLVISSATRGAAIYYTTNGSSPSATNGILFSAPIPISRTSTIRARAEKSGLLPSNVDTH